MQQRPRGCSQPQAQPDLFASVHRQPGKRFMRPGANAPQVAHNVIAHTPQSRTGKSELSRVRPIVVEHSRCGIRPPTAPYAWTKTSVPGLALLRNSQLSPYTAGDVHANSHLASSSVIVTQPRLICVPVLLCPCSHKGKDDHWKSQ